MALTAIACGDRGPDGNQCYEEANNEPWGNCPGMRPMHKWLIDGSLQSVRAVDAATDRCYDQAVAPHPPMSEKNLNAFINALKSDSSLVEKVRRANSHAAIAKIATDEGFAISEQHVIAKHDISAEELEAVSGAGNPSLVGTCGGWTGCPFTMKC